ncbi:MAG: S-layer homology domain-containing protein [Oscillibacter sp.]|nr:S-layer homology domain-containing protein [Oscillibacter sp.]
MKKFSALILALMMCMSLLPTALAADGFSDVPEDHWACADIMACAEQGIVTGYEDGTFRPEDNVTAIQFIVMMTRTFYAEQAAAVAGTEGQPWYYANTKVAEDVGMSKGLAAVDDTPMNRYNMATALYNTLVSFDKIGDEPYIVAAFNASKAFKDWDTLMISTAYAVPVAECYAAGILTGMSDGTFSGDSNMTRAQACAVIVRMMNLINGAAPVTPATPTQPEQPEQPEETGTGKLANGKDITTENVLEILAQIQEEYPTDTVWDANGTNGNYYATGGSSAEVKATMPAVNTTYGCGGWAAMVSDRIFGQSGAPARQVTDASKIRAGDIIVMLNSKNQIRHVAIVTCDATYNGTFWGYRYCDGNDNGTVQWMESGLVGINGNRIYTRYPD